MKIKANNANSPVWKDVHAHSVLPAKLEPLREIAYNLLWVWNSDATKLFNKIDSDLWKRLKEIRYSCYKRYPTTGWKKLWPTRSLWMK